MSTFFKKPWIIGVLSIVLIVLIFVVGLLTASVLERRTESLVAYSPTHPIRDFEPRNEIWGKNYPREFTSYRKTAEGNFKSKYNGNTLSDMLKGKGGRLQ